MNVTSLVCLGVYLVGFSHTIHVRAPCVGTTIRMLFKLTQNQKHSSSEHEFHKLQSKQNGAFRVSAAVKIT